jgi:hypothetical protein
VGWRSDFSAAEIRAAAPFAGPAAAVLNPEPAWTGCITCPASSIQGGFMKLNSEDLMVIRGGTGPSSGITTVEAHRVSAVMHIACASASAADSPHDEHAAGVFIVHASPDASSLEAWVPVQRSYDSIRLLGDTGVLTVGVHDLGWVVYDWVPGP